MSLTFLSNNDVVESDSQTNNFDYHALYAI